MNESIMNFVNELPSVMGMGFRIYLSDSSCDVSSSASYMIPGTELEGLIALAIKFNLSFYVTSVSVPKGFKISFRVYF